ncbi:MAG: DUF2510 domain-containing protein, partial [Acidimicrobiales bacterium]
MSDQGGHPEPGWYADPNGRHEYRYWDGATWSDQVSDGGVVSTDPPTAQGPTAATPTVEEGAAAPVAPVAMGGADTPYVPPGGDTGEGRKLPVGVLALAGLAVAAGVALMAWQASRANGLVVEAFLVPPALAAQGATGEVVARDVLDRLGQIDAQARSLETVQVSDAWTQTSKIQVAQTGLSIDDIQ